MDTSISNIYVHKYFRHFRDTLKNHTATTHRHNPPQIQHSDVYHACHIASLHTEHPRSVHSAYISRVNTSHKLSTHITHKHTSYPKYTVKTSNTQIPKLPAHTHGTQHTDKHTICVCGGAHNTDPSARVCTHSWGKTVISSCSRH